MPYRERLSRRLAQLGAKLVVPVLLTHVRVQVHRNLDRRMAEFALRLARLHVGQEKLGRARASQPTESLNSQCVRNGNDR